MVTVGRKRIKFSVKWATSILLSIVLTGCSSVTPAKKPEILYRPISFQNIDMFSLTDGWAVGQELHLWRTVDGGRVWRKVESPKVMYDTFTSARDAWFLTEPGYNTVALYNTADGGRIWHRRVMHVLTGGICRFSFISPRVGWLMIGGPAAMGEQPQHLFFTDDGGQQWKLISYNPNGTIYWMSFFSQKTGFYIGGYSNQRYGSLHVTRDGGRTWAESHFLGGRFPMISAAEGIAYRVWRAPARISDQSGVLPVTVGSGSGLWITANGGRTWAHSMLFSKSTGFSSCFFTPKRGYLLLSSSHKLSLYDTANGGGHWHLQWERTIHVPGGYTAQVNFVDPEQGWMNVYENTRTLMYATRDGGKTWTSIPAKSEITK